MFPSRVLSERPPAAAINPKTHAVAGTPPRNVIRPYAVGDYRRPRLFWPGITGEPRVAEMFCPRHPQSFLIRRHVQKGMNSATMCLACIREIRAESRYEGLRRVYDHTPD